MQKKMIKKGFFSKAEVLTPHFELGELMKKYNLNQEIYCQKALDIDGNILSGDSIEFIKKFISGCDNRLLEERKIDYGFSVIGLKK